MIIRKIGLGILACLSAWQVAAVPHVILVMADDMGYAQTSYYNHPVLKTPNLDDWRKTACVWIVFIPVHLSVPPPGRRC